MVYNLFLSMSQERNTCTQEVTELDRCRELRRETGHDALDLPLFGLGQEHAFLTVEFIWLRDWRPQLEATKQLWPGRTIRLCGVLPRRFFSRGRRPDRDRRRFRGWRFRCQDGTDKCRFYRVKRP